MVVTSHLVDDNSAVDQAQHQQADSREVFHAQERFLAELSMAQRYGPAQADEPGASAQSHTADAGEFAWPIGCDPLARDEMSREDDPKSQHANVSHDTDKAGHKSRTWVKVFFDLGL